MDDDQTEPRTPQGEPEQRGITGSGVEVVALAALGTFLGGAGVEGAKAAVKYAVKVKAQSKPAAAPPASPDDHLPNQ